MNIFGEGFPFEILAQIVTRQQIQGLKQRTTQNLVGLENNNAWCKLVSSTEELSNNKTNSIKANSYVLYNGVGKSGFTQGVATSNTINSNTAYGIGGTELGLRPMPGIVSAIITHQNRGSLKTAEVKIKAYNREQFDIVNTLYMRLGYTILLEWGHSMYYKGTKLYTSSTTLAEDFLKGGVSYLSFLSKIDKKRKSTQGNYDAILGRISNYYWDFNQDGSYDITVKISSFGDIVESLKVNVSLPSALTNVSEENSETQLAAMIIRDYATTNAIGEFLNKGVPDDDVQRIINERQNESNEQKLQREEALKNSPIPYSEIYKTPGLGANPVTWGIIASKKIWDYIKRELNSFMDDNIVSDPEK